MSVPVNARAVCGVVHGTDRDEVLKIAADALLYAARPERVYIWAGFDEQIDAERRLARVLQARGGAADASLATQLRTVPRAGCAADIVRAIAACAAVSDALVGVFGRGCRMGPSWDDSLLRHVPPGTVLTAPVDRTGRPAFVVARPAETPGAVAVQIRPLVPPLPPGPQPTALVFAPVVFADADVMKIIFSAFAADPSASQSVAMSLALADLGIQAVVATVPLLRSLLRKSETAVQAAVVDPRAASQRAIGVNVRTGVVYGQGVHGLTHAPGVAEVLCKTGSLRDACGYV